MRVGIKIIVALFFIIASFLLGKYYCLEDSDSKLNNLEKEVTTLKQENKILRDSINSYRVERINKSKGK